MESGQKGVDTYVVQGKGRREKDISDLRVLRTLNCLIAISNISDQSANQLSAGGQLAWPGLFELTDSHWRETLNSKAHKTCGKFQM